MAGPWDDPDRDPDPDEATWEMWEPDDAELTGPAGKKDVLSVSHDLTDDELRRFVNFDVFYDPMPLFGVFPQWAWFVAFTAVAGALAGFVFFRSKTALVLGGLISPIVILRMLESAAEGRRRHARALGLCDGRIVTVSPRGLTVRIPAAEETSMTGIGPLTRLWSGIRKITTSEEDITFWMRPAPGDLEGRARVVVPLRAFAGAAEAAAFESAARRWHADAGGEDAHWSEEDEL